MKILKKLLYVFLGLLAVFFIITLFLPKHAHIERSTTIDAPTGVVFNEVNDLKQWKSWSPWLSMDPDMSLEYGSTTSGKGASYSWESQDPNVGTGKMTISESTPNSFIKTVMNFAPDMEDEMYATLKFSEDNGKTKVVWDFDGDFKGMGKWFGIMMDKMLGPQYEAGLASLKAHAEKLAKEAPKSPFTITLIDYPGETFAGIRQVVSFDDMDKAFQNAYQTLGKAKVSPIGPAAGIFYTYDETKKESDMAPAFPVAADSKYAAPIRVFNLPARKGARLEFMGNYDQSYNAHTALAKYMEEKGLAQSGAVMERYLVGPNDTQNPDEYKTQIFYFYD